ncbi:molybdenum cofactor guanylyltransferase [Hyphococcus sp.]|uniref:molybdenum cofactor guanylyltransferase n=1 Tax=Hyphococcus sp. TaxID=2038636 RepID=UPI002080881F|nr:MAG: molybdenum cofactor guanylyltransferase [Marinicaulis sp.]
MPPQSEAPRFALILAGGGARRLGGVDKGAVKLAGRRLFDHVLARLSPQADQILISGAHDYGSGLPVITDREDGPRGPAAGLWAMQVWLRAHLENSEGFLSVPVDGPFVPLDLYKRLHSSAHSSIACDATGAQPTFSYWKCGALRTVLAGALENHGYPLKELAESVNAKRIMFDEPGVFENINTPEDLQRAEARLST